MELEVAETKIRSKTREAFDGFYGNWSSQAILYLSVLALTGGGAVIAEIRFNYPRAVVIVWSIVSVVLLLLVLPLGGVLVGRVERKIEEAFTRRWSAPTSSDMFVHTKGDDYRRAAKLYQHDVEALQSALRVIKERTAFLATAEDRHFPFHRSHFLDSSLLRNCFKFIWLSDRRKFKLETAHSFRRFEEHVEELLRERRGDAEEVRLFYLATYAYMLEQQLNAIERELGDETVSEAVQKLREAVRLEGK